VTFFLGIDNSFPGDIMLALEKGREMRTVIRIITITAVTMIVSFAQTQNAAFAAVASGPLTLKGHSGQVVSVAFSPDGKRLASGGKTIKIWDTVTGKELLTLKGHSDGVRSVVFSLDGKRLASGSDDTTIKIWDIPEGTKARK